MLLAEASSCV